MASLNCFCPSFNNKKKKNKRQKYSNTFQMKLNHLQEEATKIKSTSFRVLVPFSIPGSSRCNVKVMNHESPAAADHGEEVAYEGEDEMDSEFNFQACFHNPNHDKTQTQTQTLREVNSIDDFDTTNIEPIFDLNATGHVSDPGIEKVRFWASPKLKRSCSNLGTRSASLELEDQLLLSKGKSYEDLQRLAEMHTTEGGSPVSIRTRCSADNVIVKRHSSSQILPSGSRKLWWKLFLWSHRNLHRPPSTKPFLSEIKPALISHHGGYSSDSVEPPQNQWLAFPPHSSPLWRVDEWVKEVSSQPPYEQDKDNDSDIHFPSSPDNSPSHASQPSAKEATHANCVIRSLSTNSSVAHIASLGLAAIPSLSLFTSLISVNLSGNLIVQITQGSLPKGLHVLNLSRNKISTIEGLRELSHLRVLDLSYNRISRIGQGLSNCTLMKEVYLVGNKISTVEGLHRLLKLTVLDLSFNKIATAKSLGQLVANDSSLIAVNLLGNPIQSNLSDEILKKTVCSLLPKLVLLNKQPADPRRARGIRVDAALGNSRKTARKGTTRSTVSTNRRGKHRSRSHSHHHTSLKEKA